MVRALLSEAQFLDTNDGNEQRAISRWNGELWGLEPWLSS